MKIALISCSKLKTDRPCPARELYAPSRLFSLSYQYARRNADKVYILSAKYGLVEESAVIAPYDLTLADLPEYRQRDWANYVLTQMGERYTASSHGAESASCCCRKAILSPIERFPRGRIA